MSRNVPIGFTNSIKRRLVHCSVGFVMITVLRVGSCFIFPGMFVLAYMFSSALKKQLFIRNYWCVGREWCNRRSKKKWSFASLARYVLPTVIDMLPVSSARHYVQDTIWNRSIPFPPFFLSFQTYCSFLRINLYLSDYQLSCVSN